MTNLKSLPDKSLSLETISARSFAEAFGLFAVKSPGSVNNISRYIELKNKDRDSSEESEFIYLTETLMKELPSGESKEEQLAKKAFSKALKIILAEQKDKFVKEGLDMEMSNLLKDYFDLEQQ